MTRFIVVIFCAIGLFLTQPAFAKSKIDQAKDYVTIGEKGSAYQLLRQAILEDPMDGEVHYKAGLVFAEIGYTGDFDKAMGNACKLKDSYCPKIADVYYRQGFRSLEQGSTRAANRAFEKAFQYQPSKKSETLTRLLGSGKRQLTLNRIKGANLYFTSLTSFDSSYNNQVAELLFKSGKASSPSQAIEAYALAYRYSNQFKKQIGDDLADLAKNDSFSQDVRERLKREAKKYLNQEEMLVHFPPDYIQLRVDEKYILKDMKAGQESPYIRAPMGFPTLQWVSSFGTGVKFVIRDGRKYDLKRKDKRPDGNYDFKFVAYEDGAKAMVVHKKK